MIAILYSTQTSNLFWNQQRQATPWCLVIAVVAVVAVVVAVVIVAVVVAVVVVVVVVAVVVVAVVAKSPDKTNSSTKY